MKENSLARTYVRIVERHMTNWMEHPALNWAIVLGPFHQKRTNDQFGTFDGHNVSPVCLRSP